MLVIRLLRTGKKNQPYFRIVVTDKRNAPQGGNFLEILGNYNPLTKEKNVKGDRIKHWISNGAKTSPRVHNILIEEGIIEGEKISIHNIKKTSEQPKTEEQPQESKEETPAEPKTEEQPQESKEETPAEPKTEEQPQESKEENPAEPKTEEQPQENKEETPAELKIEEQPQESKEEFPAEPEIKEKEEIDDSSKKESGTNEEKK